jgi:hypothetical protein
MLWLHSGQLAVHTFGRSKLASTAAPPEVSLCTKRAATSLPFREWCRLDAGELMAAANCHGRVIIDLCDLEAIHEQCERWEVDAASYPTVAVLANADAPLGRIALCAAAPSGRTIDRPELRLRLVHGLLRLLDYKPEDESRERGSIAATGGDGEGREMAIAERLLLRRLGWESVGLACDIREQHGPPGVRRVLPWGLAARQSPDAWWLHDLHSHEGRRWRNAATRRFWERCGSARGPPGCRERTSGQARPVRRISL